MPDPQPPSPAMEKAVEAMLDAADLHSSPTRLVAETWLRAALSSLLLGEGCEELVKVAARAMCMELGYSWDGDGIDDLLGDERNLHDDRPTQESLQALASAALDALASHLLGEQKP